MDALFVGVLDRETRRILISHRASTAPASAAALRVLEERLAAWMIEERRELRIDDLEDRAGAGPFDGRPSEVSLRSLIAVPLVVDREVVGVLSVLSEAPRAYDEHQVAVLATIAQQAAVAIENARHHALATIDSLTGLYLRETFFRRLREEHARAQRYGGSYALLMIDLDGFKQINDRDGHLAGDRYLRAAGAAIRSRLRAADLACRYGGDEFCVLLPETDLAGARPIAERLREGIAELVVEVESGAVRTTASIGISVHPGHAEDVTGLLLRADQALYQAKRTGRDRVVTWASPSRAQDVLHPAARARGERLGQ